MNFFDIFINKQAHYMTVTSKLILRKTFFLFIFFFFFFFFFISFLLFISIFHGPGVMVSYSNHAICP